MLTIHEHILPRSAARPMIKLRKFSGVTIHETANTSSTATAASHDTYMHVNGGKNSEVSYHYVVDDKEAYHFIPDDEVAWHAGDGGAGKGNCETIAIEICVNKGGDFKKAVQNAAELSAIILHRHNIRNVVDGTQDRNNGNLFQHNTFSSFHKNCPMIIRDNGLWSNSLQDVTNHLNMLYGVPDNNVSQCVPPFRVRLTANDVETQIGAFSVFGNAVAFAQRNIGYSVFDALGKKLY